MPTFIPKKTQVSPDGFCKSYKPKPEHIKKLKTYLSKIKNES